MFCSFTITIYIHYVGVYARSLIVSALAICLLGPIDPNSMLGYSLKMTINSSSIINIGYIILFLDSKQCLATSSKQRLNIHPRHPTIHLLLRRARPQDLHLTWLGWLIRLPAVCQCRRSWLGIRRPILHFWGAVWGVDRLLWPVLVGGDRPSLHSLVTAVISGVSGSVGGYWLVGA